MRRVVLVAPALAAAMVTSGCASNAPGDLNAAATNVLYPAVQTIRQVAKTGSYRELRQSVVQLKALVSEQQRLGNVSMSRATAIEDAADVLLQDARPSPRPVPTVTSESPTPTPTQTTQSPTPTPTPTSESPSPTPTESSPGPVVSASVGAVPQDHRRKGRPDEASPG
ncbi:MAG TPA: hypothetical protein VFT62_06090 [Mycobacteriales bacterium]|nr:hypothetical protein [Mycobacteriales bacterium]